MLNTGQWSGREVFCVGGGLSLKHFEWSLLDGKAWIGCNVAGFKAPVCLAADGRWVREFGTDPRFLPTTERVWLRAEGWMPPEPWQALDAAKPQRWTDRLEDGLVNGPLTGISAIHLADILGASVIYLLGYDMVGAHYHREYEDADVRTKSDSATTSWVASAGTWRAHLEHFDRWAPCVRAEVYNLCPGSALKCFPIRQPMWRGGEIAGLIRTLEPIA
jgi:hypothetical protein